MLIVTSKTFPSDSSHVILHMPRPCLTPLKSLFAENPSLEWMVLTDCVEPLFEHDLMRIEKERKESCFDTHLKATFVVHRSFSCKHAECGPSWALLFQGCQNEMRVGS